LGCASTVVVVWTLTLRGATTAVAAPCPASIVVAARLLIPLQLLSALSAGTSCVRRSRVLLPPCALRTWTADCAVCCAAGTCASTSRCGLLCSACLMTGATAPVRSATSSCYALSSWPRPRYVCDRDFARGGSCSFYAVGGLPKRICAMEGHATLLLACIHSQHAVAGTAFCKLAINAAADAALAHLRGHISRAAGRCRGAAA
jgi:hypothetical protein